MIPDHIRDLIEAGALFVCNHSGGKDSQRMYLFLRSIIPARQLLVIHASLGEVEWPGTIEHIRATTAGTDLIVTSARRSFFDMVEDRRMFPSPKNRQCTTAAQQLLPEGD